VTRVFQEFFHVNSRIAEELAGFLTGHRHGIDQRRLGMHDAHAATTATASRLDDHRVTDGSGDLDDFLGVFRQRTIGPGHTGHAGRLHGILGRYLVTHQTDGFGLRADEDKARGLDALGEVGVF